jgi:hypothetical protein
MAIVINAAGIFQAPKRFAKANLKQKSEEQWWSGLSAILQPKSPCDA